MSALAGHGYHPSTVPINLGGQWTYDYAQEWLLDRLQLETAEQFSPRIMPCVPSAAEPAANLYNPLGETLTTTTTTSVPALPPPAAWPSFSTQYAPVAAAPAAPPLGPEMVLETDLIRRAREELAIEVPSEEVQAARERNALYSRRSYHKRKKLKVSLEAEIKDLQERNDALRVEQERLETHLRQAQALIANLKS